MTPTGADIVLDTPPERDLPAARREAIRQLLEDVVTDSRPAPTPHHPRRLWQGLAMAATTAVVVAAMIVTNVATTGEEIAHAATPPVLNGELADGEPAASTLHELARTAADDQADDPSRRIRTESWWLSVSVDGEGASEKVSTAVTPILRDRIFRDDGTVRIREVRGEPQFPNEKYRRAWDAQGHPDSTGTILLDETVPAERLDTAYPADLPTDPDSLRAQLLSTTPPEESAATLFTAINDVHSERVVEPPTRAAALRLLAEDEGVVSLGEMTDRAGREAMAFATDSTASGLERRHVLFVDPDDGAVLAYEEILTGDTGRLGISSPSVVAYTLFR